MHILTYILISWDKFQSHIFERALYSGFALKLGRFLEVREGAPEICSSLSWWQEKAPKVSQFIPPYDRVFSPSWPILHLYSFFWAFITNIAQTLLTYLQLSHASLFLTINIRTYEVYYEGYQGILETISSSSVNMPPVLSIGPWTEAPHSIISCVLTPGTKGTFLETELWSRFSSRVTHLPFETALFRCQRTRLVESGPVFCPSRHFYTVWNWKCWLNANKSLTNVAQAEYCPC